MIQLDEYVVADVFFVLAALSLFFKAIHWNGISGCERQKQTYEGLAM